MSENHTRRRHHRGRRSRKKAGIISNIILVIAVVVFCVSGFQLFKIGKGYLDGRSEYEKVRDLAVTNPEEKEGFRVDFNALLEVNPDTVGWIRFYPEPFILSMLYYSFSNNPITIFSLVIGNSRIHNPVALNTAWANAGDGVLITISPIDFAPNGPVGS